MTKVPDRPVADIVILIHFTGYSMTVEKLSKHKTQKMGANEEPPPPNPEENNSNENNIDLNELSEEIRQTIEDVDEAEETEDFDEEGESIWSHDFQKPEIIQLYSRPYLCYKIVCVDVYSLIHYFSAYRALDAQLDRLNSALDAIEERNDRIHGQMKELLKVIIEYMYAFTDAYKCFSSYLTKE